MAEKEKSVFEVLSSIDVSDKVERKGNLSYVSWATAWAELKKAYPDANSTIYERETDHGPVNYFTDGKTCWVKTGVTVNGIEHIEMLYVMDFRNNSIPLDKVTSKDVNTAIQRSITKAIARHGLGISVYQGEDIHAYDTEEENDAAKKANASTKGKTIKGVDIVDGVPGW